MADCKHNWRWVSDDDNDGTGDFWWCDMCGRVVWGDDPAYTPAVTTHSSNTITYIPFTLPWGTEAT